MGVFCLSAALLALNGFTSNGVCILYIVPIHSVVGVLHCIVFGTPDPVAVKLVKASDGAIR